MEFDKRILGGGMVSGERASLAEFLEERCMGGEWSSVLYIFIGYVVKRSVGGGDGCRGFRECGVGVMDGVVEEGDYAELDDTRVGGSFKIDDMYGGIHTVGN